MAFRRRTVPVLLLLAALSAVTSAAWSQAPPLASFSLSGPSARAQLGSLAAGPADGSFLATWREPGDGTLRARLFGHRWATGGPPVAAGPAGPDLVLAAPASTARSAAAYNARTGEFLVVWQSAGASPHVWGQRIGAEGRTVGSALPISSVYSVQGAPSVAVHAGTGRALVVWDDNFNLAETDWEIAGLLLEPDGAPAGGDLLLTYAPNQQLAPQVACDPVRGRYLVVWEDEREIFGASTNRDIFAQVVDTDGEMRGEALLLTRTAATRAGIAVAARPGTGEFLVAWAELGDGAATAPDLRVRRVLSDTGGMGPATALEGPGEPLQPALAYHEPSSRYLLAWTDRREFPGAASLALARVLAPDGASVSDEFDLAVDAHGPALAPLPDAGRVLAGWTDLGRGGIWAAYLDPAGPPAPMPQVLDERPFTADGTRLDAAWSTVGFSGGIREYRTAIGTAPGRDDVAPWASAGQPEEAIVTGSRTGLRLMEDRTYYFAVVAVGMDGRTSRVGSSSGVTIDQTAPQITITRSPPAALQGTTALLAFEGSDRLVAPALLRYRWRLDASAWSLPSPGTTLRLEGLAVGEHRFEVQAVDLADNVSVAAVATFQVMP